MAQSVKLSDGSYIDVSGGYIPEYGMTLEEALLILLADGAGAHNGIYRGKYLGDSVTDEQYAAIADGTFRGLYIGDYWTINSVNYRIAAFDYLLNAGSLTCESHHVVVVPDTCLYNAQMNTSSTTTGGYVGSAMYKTNLENAKTTIEAAFSGHVLNHSIYLTNTITNGRASDGAWRNSEVDLMCEQMVYGSGIFSPVSSGSSIPLNHRGEKSQLPLFALEPSRINIESAWWLRDVISAANFTCVLPSGNAGYNSASALCGVRPYFCIY